MEDINILNYSILGFEFEFYSNYSDNETAKKLSELLNKKIPVYDKAHSDMAVTDEIFKLEKDFSGGQKMVELVSGPLPYKESIVLLKKVFDWINENGYTNSRSSIHINISFNKDIVGKNFLNKLDVLKFILDFDENKIYELFPIRKDSVYAKSIKHIIPKNKFYIENPKSISSKDFILPSLKYYGINFSKLMKGYLEFRYIGGKDYQKRYDDIMNLINYYIITLYQSIINKEYTKENKKELKRIIKLHMHLLKSYKSYKDFLIEYPNIKLMYDLRDNPVIMTTVYNNIRNKIFDILNFTNIESGFINYNSDTGKYEIKDAKIDKIFNLDNVDLINCEIRGFVSNLNLFDCTLINTDIKDSKLYNCKIKNSKVQNSYINNLCEIIDSYIFGKKGIMNGSMTGGIFREGKLTNDAKFTDTEIVTYTQI